MENNEQLALKKSLYTARKTILFQFGAAVLSLLIGFGIIFLFTKWANNWDVRYPDNSQHDFFLNALYSTIGLLFAVGYSTIQQFENNLDQNSIFHLSLKISFYCGVAIICFITFFFFLVGATFKLIFLHFTFQLSLSVILGIVIGFLHIIRLNIEGYDQDEHQWLLSNEADLNACKLGVFPYRQRVKSFWFVILTTIMFITLGAMFYIVLTNDPSFFVSVFLLVLIFGAVYILIKKIWQIFHPAIFWQEGKVLKEYVPKKGRSPSQYILFFNNHGYQTDSKTWNSVIESKKYRLWLSGVDSHILSTELIEKNTTSTTNLKLPTIEELKEIEKNK